MEKKLLLIRPGDTQELSFEEVLVKYDNLIHNRALKWTNFYDLDEMKQIASIGLWKAYKKYDAEKGIGFGWFADVVIRNEFYVYHRNNMQRHTKAGAQVKLIISMDTPVTEDENITIADIVSDGIDFVEELADKEIGKSLIEEIHRLRSSDERIMNLYLMGYNQTEIGKIISRSQAQVSRQMKRSFESIRKAYTRNELMGGGWNGKSKSVG
ncbi:sigma-70 family RNA polymerase sigma factor [Anaerosolibacter sp.]|uniref:sigma-70 family RNA polymerase sigma factor n=1 Tax=Anaerosolibacter sp. TaxID=1872527 RepID=UPI0039F0774D